MIILPAIDLYHGQAVRLLRGDYDNMTVYDPEPVNTAMKFKASGAEWIHIVDLEGAKSGGTPNIETIIEIKRSCGLKCETGGGIRDMKTIERYIDSGIDRVILGTSAVTHEGFAAEAVKTFGSEHVAVGVDIKNGNVAIKGWLEDSQINAFGFCKRMQDDGVNVIICTDISRDGAMRGTNRELYASMSEKFSMNIIASGGVSTLDDVKALAEMKLYGAIIGKAYYTGAIDLTLAIKAAKS
ncbi:MAG: 1-(5-phosphoribosyl)-5-[Synergistaceae bacterium]|nr:1-(5-phosphoribosyl)-5-[(5-phosphoribosylamino)methylideneamino]imidazole-4-carboxamide isomerase [Synergistaceae bacterium]MBQ3449001.1 1-(5-phosphoribosyl)-5-[(5-phosphoribosylamino)methylideneamino]imidazole-4-carboxamide isomerase [Synergistaceae bacterium]MBQ3694795.1 1-(5-phosphoribosyl)-5-[(5-phosphoribosylamino)methylideneamino]imidazole-4-carboxamide isomerase [Synergistaceae bacterium]MBQ6111658.1 1-(5-phosphoribosyl)-5-[(5-phosphoribosylamino)methylideneamino]imidazole-4-carboxamid